ncbi:MAG: MobA/MobL family protein [Alphaproteobacteria bacterium]
MAASDFKWSDDHPVKMGRLLGEHGEEERIAKSIFSLFRSRPRPTDKFGRTHFHMSMTKVTRGSCGYSSGQAARFEKYIERESAVELDAEGPISFGNIGEDTGECCNFWKEVEAFERRCDARIQERIELEIPIELRNKGTIPRQLLQEFSQVFRDRDLPFHVVVHIPPVEEEMGDTGVPDTMGSPLNIHAHILWAERPFERIGRREWRFARKKNRDVHQKMFPAVLRNRYSEIANKYLSLQPNIKKRLTPHSFADMGVDRKPLWHASRASMHALSRGVLSDEILSLAGVLAENQLLDLQKEEERLVASLADFETEKALDKTIPVFIVEKTPGTYTRCIWLGEPEPDQEPLTRTRKDSVEKVIERLANDYGLEQWRIEDYSDKKASEERQSERYYRKIDDYRIKHEKEVASKPPRPLVDPASIELSQEEYLKTVKYAWYEVYGFYAEDKVFDQAIQARLCGDTPVEFIVMTTKKRGLFPADPIDDRKPIEEVVSRAERKFQDLQKPQPTAKSHQLEPVQNIIHNQEDIKKKGYWVADDPIDPMAISNGFRGMNDEELRKLQDETEDAIKAIAENPSVIPTHWKPGLERGLNIIKSEQKLRTKRNALYKNSTHHRTRKGWNI